MSILNQIQPVNQPQRVTNTEGSSNLIDVTRLPLYAEGNDLVASELLVKLNKAKEDRPKLIRSSTPTTVISNIPKIHASYEQTNGKPLPANELSSIREVMVNGTVTSIQTISEAIFSKFYLSGKNTKPESALAYAEYLQNLAATLVEYAHELKLTKESYVKLTKYDYDIVQELQDLYEAQFMVEESFAINGSSWSTENDRREKEAKTERMFQKFDLFEQWQKDQAKA